MSDTSGTGRLRGSTAAWRYAALGWATVVILFGLVPTREALQAVAGQRETAATVAGHFIEYALLAFLLAAALGGWRRDSRALLPAALLAIGLGGAIEAVQGLLPYRDAQLLDVVVNAAGAALGLALFSSVAPRRPGLRRRRPG